MTVRSLPGFEPDRVPDLVELHQRNPDRWPFLLHSASPGATGHSSLLLYVDADSVSIDGGADFLGRLDAAWLSERTEQDDDQPFAGGWFVFLGYELAGQIEPKLNLVPAAMDVPVAFAVRSRGALVVDHRTGRCTVAAESGAWADEILDCLDESMRGSNDAAPAEPPASLEVHADDGQIFMAGVDRIREYILDGDVFQVNLSRGWRARSECPMDVVGLYRKLADRNPAPFAGLARLPGGSILSSSPERLVSSRNGRVETRPIAGTRPRGQSPDHDRALSAELIGHPKERAEHVMLIDLERNDLGRVCQTGSVRVDELMGIESYTHVHHIVSNVTGVLTPGTSPGQIIRAVFPGGTITGCPKVRCMEIIAELEPSGRGIYTGSMGYLGLDGRMDLNILIRSMFVSDLEIHFRTGAGIVADSEPRAELAETEAKARGLLHALQS